MKTQGQTHGFSRGMNQLIAAIEGRHNLNPKGNLSEGEEFLVATALVLGDIGFVDSSEINTPDVKRYQNLVGPPRALASRFVRITEEILASDEISDSRNSITETPSRLEAVLLGLEQTLLAYQLTLDKVESERFRQESEKQELLQVIDAYYFAYFHSFMGELAEEFHRHQFLMDHRGELESAFQLGSLESLFDHFSRDLNYGKKVYILHDSMSLVAVSEVLETYSGADLRYSRLSTFLSRSLFYFHLSELTHITEQAKPLLKELGMLMAVVNENGRKRARQEDQRANSDRPFRRNNPYRLSQVVHMGIIWKAVVLGIEQNFNYNTDRTSSSHFLTSESYRNPVDSGISGDTCEALIKSLRLK